MTIENKDINISSDIEKEELELKQLLIQLDERNRHYAILDIDIVNWKGWRPPILKQAELFNDFKSRLNTPIDERLRYLLYYGGNGAWKTFLGAYICVLLALGHSTTKYGLPFIGAKKNIWIATKSGNNVKTTIDKYLLGNGSPTRIPPDEIDKEIRDNQILKGIKLKNGCKINIVTYDQGRENVQGDTPDFLWMDEEPTNEEVWTELRFRTRWEECETLITMTPLSGLTPVYQFFFEQTSQEVMDKSKVYKVSALDNPHTDKTITKGLTEEQYRLRVEGSFENPTGLVYNEFLRTRSVVPHFDPKLLWSDTKYYKAIDFGTTHPTAIIFMAQDIDDNLYVFDEWEESNVALWDIVDVINQKSIWYNFEYFVRDSASAREGLEFQRLGIKTVTADKYSKGANDMSNRRAGIMLINNLFNNNKLLISDRCRKLIRELETHYYKDWSRKDWEVNKENDDLLDALRYIIFMVKKNTWVNKKSMIMREYESEYGTWGGLRLL